MKALFLAAVLLAPASVSAQHELATVPVLSTKLVDVGAANRLLEKAEREGHAWVTDPILVAGAAMRAIPASMEAQTVLVTRRDDRPQGPDTSTVVILIDGLQDDSVRGERFEFELVARVPSDSLYQAGIRRTWRVVRANQSWRCARGRDVDAFYEWFCP